MTIGALSVATFMLSLVVSNRDITAEQAATFNFAIRVQDEAGSPVGDARFLGSGVDEPAASDGVIVLSDAREVIAGWVEAPGFLPSPLVVGVGDASATLDVRLWSEREGRRFSYNAAGDFMLGARHGLDGELSSEVERAAYAPFGSILGAASLSSVSLSSVVTDLPATAAAPGRNPTFAMSPAASGVLSGFGVDFVSVANDHARDYGERGIIETTSNLARREIQTVGAGTTGTEAAAPLALRVGRNSVAVFAYSLVDGDEFNDALPTRDEITFDAPAWQREFRLWSFSWQGVELAPDLLRTAGESWQLFLTVERDWPEATDAAWESLTLVFPQLQHSVAQRGSGGANPWRAGGSRVEIERASSDNTAVIVHLHAGNVRQLAPTEEMRTAARTAIDAGADLVVGHHPHVLQGAESYNGRLIFYSLGNLAFDRGGSFADTSGVLHTVWERDELLEVRFIPVLVDAHAPYPVADIAADTLLRELLVRSMLPATAQADLDLSQLPWVGTRPHELAPIRRPAIERSATHLPNFERQGNGLLVSAFEPASEAAQGAATVSAEQTLVVEPDDFVRLEGRPVLPWGEGAGDAALRLGIERNLDPGLDFRLMGEEVAPHWALGPATSITADGGSRGRYLEMRPDAVSGEPVMAGLRSRIAIGRNDLFDSVGASSSAPHSYEIRLLGRLTSAAEPQLRVRYFEVNPRGANLTSERLIVRTDQYPIGLPADGAWHLMTFALEVPQGGAEMEIEVLADPAMGGGSLGIDDFRMIEWRAPQGPTIPLPADYLRVDGRGPATLHTHVVIAPSIAE